MITGWCLAGQHNKCPRQVHFSQQHRTAICQCTHPQCPHREQANT